MPTTDWKAPIDIPTLTPAGCRVRQQRFADALRRIGADAAMIGQRQNVHYLTGFWPHQSFPAAALLRVDGNGHSIRLIAARESAPVERAGLDEVRFVALSRGASIIDHPLSAVLAAAVDGVGKMSRLATDVALPEPVAAVADELSDAVLPLTHVSRCKEQDEVALIRAAVAGCQAAYAEVRSRLADGVTEVEMASWCYAAAVRALGLPVGEMGNDFRCAGGGGAPTRRPMRAGELLTLDLGLNCHGYWADLCRTFCVGGKPSRLQRLAHERIMQVFAEIEPQLKPRAITTMLHDYSIARLHGFEDLTFDHHLGHGVGMRPHETPRLNNHFDDDELRVGDVFTIEPGLYGEELRSGMRIEQMYWMRESGAERLSSFPVDL